jgi:hypothetical protein
MLVEINNITSNIISRSVNKEEVGSKGASANKGERRSEV